MSVRYSAVTREDESSIKMNHNGANWAWAGVLIQLAAT